MNIHESDAALLDAFLDNELSEEEAREFQLHLEQCPQCQAYIEEWNILRNAFPSPEDTPVPDGFSDTVQSVLPARNRRFTKRPPWIALAVSAAACCAIVLLQQHGPLSGGTSAPLSNASVVYSAMSAAETSLQDYDAAMTGSTAIATDTVGSVSAPQEPASDGASSSSPMSGPESDAEYACILRLSRAEVGSALDAFEGTPASLQKHGFTGTLYVLNQAEFQQFLLTAPSGVSASVSETINADGLICIEVTEP